MKITSKMMYKKTRCPWPEYTLEKIQDILEDGKTLLEISRLKIPSGHQIWAITQFLSDLANRAFAIWCARQCRTDFPEITAYIDTIEAHCVYGTATSRDVWLAKNAVEKVMGLCNNIIVNPIENRNAFLAARFAYLWSPKDVADWTACGIPSSPVPGMPFWGKDNGRTLRRKQLEKLKELIGEETHNGKG